jgi:D-alanine-D-alanine ligase
MHKRVARVLFERAGLPVARGLDVARGDALMAAERVRREVGDRLVVKPSSHGSAIGVVRLESDATVSQVAAAIEAVWALDDFAIVEHFARGREVTCGVLDVEATSAPAAFAPTEIFSPDDPFYTFEARYAPGRSRHVCPADLAPAVAAWVQEVAVAAHRALGCRDLSRVDFIVGDEGAPDAVTLLEVNTLPGMTATSLYPEAAAAGGVSMAGLCGGFVARAYARGPARRLPARPMPGRN